MSYLITRGKSTHTVYWREDPPAWVNSKTEATTFESRKEAREVAQDTVAVYQQFDIVED